MYKRDLLARETWMGLSQEHKDLINSLTPKTLYYSNVALQEYLNTRIKQGIDKKKIKEGIKISIASGLFHSLVFPVVLATIKADKSKKVFLKMDNDLIMCFLSCWVVSVVGEGIIQENIVLRYKIRKNKYSLNENIKKLVNLGLLQEMDQKTIYNKTGKISASNNLGGQKKNTYKLSLKGHAEIQKFVSIYENIHSKITENLNFHDLIKL